MVRTIDPHQKIAQVVKVARTLFVTRGYHNVSIPLLVQESGVSIGAIYHHFTSKEGVAKIVHEQTLEQFQAQLHEHLQPYSDTREKLVAFTRLVFQVTEEDPEVMEYMLLMKHGEFLTDVPPICSTRPFRKIQDVIEEGMTQGELRQGDSFLAAVAFTGVILRAVELRLSGVITESLDTVTDVLMQHAWASLM